jgi:type IV secretory pathway VirB10-like protein
MSLAYRVINLAQCLFLTLVVGSVFLTCCTSQALRDAGPAAQEFETGSLFLNMETDTAHEDTDDEDAATSKKKKPSLADKPSKEPKPEKATRGKPAKEPKPPKPPKPVKEPKPEKEDKVLTRAQANHAEAVGAYSGSVRRAIIIMSSCLRLADWAEMGRPHTLTIVRFSTSCSHTELNQSSYVCATSPAGCSCEPYSLVVVTHDCSCEATSLIQDFGNVTTIAALRALALATTSNKLRVSESQLKSRRQLTAEADSNMCG